jgi:hypothetical protein
MKIELNIIIFFINKMDDSKSELVLMQISYNKLVLKKRYMIITQMHKLVYTGTYFYMFGPNDPIGDMLGLGQPVFIDIKPNIENKTMLICTSSDKFYDLKVKME